MPDTIYFDGRPSTPAAAAERFRAAGVAPAYIDLALATAAVFGAEGLKSWYISGKGAEEIQWGEKGCFQRCVDIAAEHMDEDQAKGFCANCHKSAVGKWPGAARGKSEGGAGKPKAVDQD